MLVAKLSGVNPPQIQIKFNPEDEAFIMRNIYRFFNMKLRKLL